MSSNSEEVDQKKHSQKIDKDIEEDAKKMRRECKILLLGRLQPHGTSSGHARTHAATVLLTTAQARASRASRPL